MIREIYKHLENMWIFYAVHTKSTSHSNYLHPPRSSLLSQKGEKKNSLQKTMPIQFPFMSNRTNQSSIPQICILPSPTVAIYHSSRPSQFLIFLWRRVCAPIWGWCSLRTHHRVWAEQLISFKLKKGLFWFAFQQWHNLKHCWPLFRFWMRTC